MRTRAPEPLLPVSASSPVSAEDEEVADGVGEVVLGEAEEVDEGEVVAVGLGDAEAVGEEVAPRTSFTCAEAAPVTRTRPATP